ncbi:MAG TPA: tripartite tricarboxylate transporter substrate-binding protein [Candidatus Binatia bacterium]|jgi:tripartite-type tricarboxylate transporter receptor subunit TctC|nr:tripartite tricarboxylate transporter substrate-binding protein [Candidatus Binatia bacterium]
MQRQGLTLTTICLAVFLFAPGLASKAWTQAEPFYKGKTIRIMVGSTAGGFYDRWARLFARYMGKYIPGQPEIIAQNMPGAGSVIAANHVFNVAKPDGLTIAMPLNSLYVDQLAGRSEVQFDLRKFHWIGSPAVESVIMYMRADTPYRSIADIVKAKEPPKCGGTGTASSDYILAKVLEETIGARINNVLGYAGGTEIDIAVEKGEVVCRAHSTSAHFGREPFDTWHKKGFDRHLVQTSRKRDSRAPDVPTVNEIFDQFKVPANSRQIAQVVLAAGDFGRPMIVTPGTPSERVKILRDAFFKTLSDPEVLAEAKKSRMDVEPTSGEELESLVKEIFDSPPEVLERVKKLLAN